jgi:hypothetical protein
MITVFIGIRNKSATIISTLSILSIIAITLHLTQSNNPLILLLLLLLHSRYEIKGL